MYCAKLTIPKMSDTYKLYVYRSKNAESINTISKIRTIQPTIVIDESTAKAQTINGTEYYVVYDKADFMAPGVTYNGPVPNLVPVTEYETQVTVVPVNDYTYVNKLVLNELPIKYMGTMLYYSVIGVDEENGLITHLSKVNGVMVDSDYQLNGTRHLYSCDENTGAATDIWNYVSSVSWDEEIKIGDVTDPATMAKFGVPMVEAVNIFSGEEVNASTRPVNSRNFMVLEIPNPWQRNNQKYNYRRMKSYKLQNVCDEQYSDFSEPTYQSLLPVSLEKMLILKKTDPKNPNEIISVNDTDCEMYQVIRKDGIYYNAKDHRKLGLNKYNIPLEEKIGVFSEGSVQDQIKMQVEALPNHVYAFTIYLFDVYGNISKPAHFVVET
jgi:hypothetical protein